VNEYTGTATLVRLFLRRDRVRLSLWATLAAIYAPFVIAP
jgi:putative exporter of polyketide antibiotics